MPFTHANQLGLESNLFERVLRLRQQVPQNRKAVFSIAEAAKDYGGVRRVDAAGIAYQYIEHGSYFGGWRARNAWKMWTGWPTLPMVFVRGVLVGGCDNVQRMLAGGELQRMLAAGDAATAG